MLTTEKDTLNVLKGTVYSVESHSGAYVFYGEPELITVDYKVHLIEGDHENNETYISHYFVEWNSREDYKQYIRDCYTSDPEEQCGNLISFSQFNALKQQSISDCSKSKSKFTK